jgi:hypothetical protein
MLVSILALPYLGQVSAIRGIRPRMTAVVENAAQPEEQQPRLDERLMDGPVEAEEPLWLRV